MSKKIICWMLCSILCLSNGFIVAAWATSFTDLSGTTYETAVTDLVSKGIISGYSDGTFKPENGITRAEAVTIIVNAMAPGDDVLNLDRTNRFRDVSSTYWAEKTINFATARGIVSGFGEQLFKPENMVTYHELASMLVNALGYDKNSLTGKWPMNYQNKAKELGIFDKVDTKASTFTYEGHATRGNAALMVYSVFEELNNMGHEVPEEKGSSNIETNGISNSNEFAGAVIQLSLKDAVAKMKNTGYLAQMAEINKKSDEAVAKGYSESTSKMSDYLKMMDNLPLDAAYKLQEEGVTETNRDMLKIQRDFAKANINYNYEADMNSIEQKTVQLYYGVIQAEDNLRVCNENLAVQKSLLSYVKQKNNNGKATKLEVSSQQSIVISAEQSVKEAMETLKKAKMQFNILLGYDVMHNTEYPEGLVLLELPKIDLTEAINTAVENRLDYKRLQMTEKMYTIYCNNKRAQNGSDSSEALSAQATLLMIQLNVNNMPKNIEAEIRGLYDNLQTNYQAIEAAKSTLALAEEAVKTKQLLYESGLTTFSEVQKAQLTVYQTHQLLTAKIATFDLTIYEWKFATGVGTKRIAF